MTYPYSRPVISQMVVRKERWPGFYKGRFIPLVSPGQDVSPAQPVLRLEPGAQTFPAGVYGHVVGVSNRGGVVIESKATIIRGAFGVGNQVVGKLTMWPISNSERQTVSSGAILIVPGPLNLAMLHQALSAGIAGIVASSIAVRDLEGFLQADLIQLMDSADIEKAQAHLPPIGILLTEGFGAVAMPAHILNLLNQYYGAVVLLSGVTSVHQRIYPELIISLSEGEVQRGWSPVRPEQLLRLGTAVRVLGGEYESAVGVIDYFFSHQQKFPSGVNGRAVRLRLSDGSLVVVPITLIERI